MKKETYEIGELSGEAKERAIEAIRDTRAFQDRDIDLDWLVDRLQEDLEDSGFDSAEISFSGFWSKGDGASFIGKVDDKEKFFDAVGFHHSDIHPAIWSFIEENLEISIMRTSSRYVHEGTVRVDWDFYDDPVIELFSGLGMEDLSVDVEQFLEKEGFWGKATEWKNSKCNEIYSALEKAYEGEFNEEAVEDWADQMGLLFDEEGNEV